MTLYDKALLAAVLAHAGQKRWDGETPYIVHPIAVAAALDDETDKVVALLHDTVEDKKLTLAEVEKRFGKIVAEAVDALSRRKDEGETYTDFILRAKQNPIARRVKIADIKDNLLTTTDELRGRYEKALKELTT